LRRLSLPATAKEKFDQVLRLQIEAEFPLAPDELAWGYQALPTSGTAAKQEVLVAAVKREVIEEYRGVLTACGLEPVFTLAALARNFLCPQPSGTHALLDIGSQRLELVIFEKGIPTAIRLLPAGAEASLPEAIARAAGANWNREKIYLTGMNEAQVAQLAQRLNGAGECVPLPVTSGTCAAILGLKISVEQTNGATLLLLQNRAKPVAGRFNVSSAELKPWLAAAAILVGLLLLLPFAEAVVLKPFLSRKLAALQSEKGRLATIDHELEFLQSLKQNQPPYLDALFVFAKSAPPGTRFDSLNMDKRGEVSLHGLMQNSTQVTDFRAKLIASGFFSIVTVEEQSPTPDRQRVNLRMTAQWKPAEARTGLTVGPTADEIQQAKTNHDAGAGGGGGFPPGMMFP
jgi:Tfp pilus assembly protein PilN